MAFSTRESHWWPAAATPRPDGYIVLLDERGPRIVCDDIFFTNEIRLDAAEEYLYVAETMKARIIRFCAQPDGSLTDKEVVGPDGLGVGGAVDGFTFDAEGNVWVTTVLRNGVGIITTNGDYHVVFEEANEPLLATFDEKIAAGTGQPADMMATVGKTLQFVTSVTFGGPDLRTVYIGSLGMNCLPTFVPRSGAADAELEIAVREGNFLPKGPFPLQFKDMRKTERSHVESMRYFRACSVRKEGTPCLTG